jgi:hypothetical protein
MNTEAGKPIASMVTARQYSRRIAAVADLLAPFDLNVVEGTPTNVRRVVLIESDADLGPIVLVRVELDSDGDEKAPPAVQLLAGALAAGMGGRGIDLRVLCVPQDWNTMPPGIQGAVREADVALALAVHPGDLNPRESDRRRLRVRIIPRPRKRHFAEWLERHPFLYSLAVLGEFCVKHPLFGQVLCGGPCGISGAWQFTCTMGKTFVPKSQIEQNFLARPVFEPVRKSERVAVRSLWRVWEWILRQALWPAIGLRKAIVYIASHLPRRWFHEANGIFRTTLATVFNHLECPKSLRNGACGAPTREGLCGELLKYGVVKPCIFHYRNTRDMAGQRFASRLLSRAERWRNSGGRLGGWGATVLETAAAIVNRRPLSMHVYPQVDTGVAGASAVVSAMRGRFKGVTVFGAVEALPPAIARSHITVSALSDRGERMLLKIRKVVRGLPSHVGGRVTALAAILDALAQEELGAAAEAGSLEAQGTTYERVLAHEAGAGWVRRPEGGRRSAAATEQRNASR